MIDKSSDILMRISSKERWLMLAVVVLLIKAINRVNCGNINFWHFDSSVSNSTFQQVTYDGVTGEVFAASQNYVYKFNQFLKLLSSLKTVSTFDCQQADSSCPPNQLTENDVKVFEFIPVSKLILFCGSVSLGLCSIISSEKFDSLRYLDPVNSANYAGGQSDLFAFLEMDRNAGINGTSLHVARTYNAQPKSKWNAISARTMSDLQDAVFDVGSLLTKDFEPGFRKKYIVRYVYGFDHDGFVYYLTVQKDPAGESGTFETRLVRFCKNDTKFNSYSEISLSCRKKYAVRTFLNIAQAGYLAVMGKDLAERFKLSANESVLYVMMGRNDVGNIPDPRHGFGLCIYTMSEIRTAFMRAQKDCYLGNGRLLPWISSSEPKCTENLEIAASMKEDFCGNQINAGIGSRYPLSTETNFTTDAFQTTSLGITLQGNKTVAVVGTSSGHVLKVLIDATNSLPYAVLDIGSNLADPAVAKDMTFDLLQEHVYVLTGSRITRVPLKSCAIYNDCEECVTSKDPLECGWCNDHCSRESECLIGWSKKQCPPIIDTFYPENGPVQGGTRVTITGRNFGNGTAPIAESSASVKVALVDCAIEFRNATSIVCQTGFSVRGAVEKEVKLTVSDVSRTTGEFEIQGTISSGHLNFAYKSPSLLSVHPMFGPTSGGTRVTVKGDNMDIGSNRFISAGHRPCILISISKNVLICNTSEFDLSKPAMKTSPLQLPSPDVVGQGPIVINIDGAVLGGDKSTFVYKKDPVVSDVYPLRSILSGGMPVTIRGRYLNSVQNPMLCLTSDLEKLSHISLCQPNLSGTEMVCLSPNLTSFNYSISEDQPFKFRLNFLMDGVKELVDFQRDHPQLNQFSYSVDPVFHKFPEPGHVRLFYTDENYLDIQGTNFDLAAMSSDYSVTIGDIRCRITQLASSLLLCQPIKPEVIGPSETARPVKVYVGKLVFLVGYLQFSERQVDMKVIAMIVPATLLAVGLSIVVMALWLHRMCRRLKKQESIAYIHVPHASPFPDSCQNSSQVQRIIQFQTCFWAQQRANESSTHPVNLQPILDFQVKQLIYNTHLVIPREQIMLLDVIGQGHFGYVHRGILIQDEGKKAAEVAIKTLKTTADNNWHIHGNEPQKFLEEALRMREFDHQHILKLIGISLDKDNSLLVVLPFMKHGDLLAYIRSENNSPTVKQLMQFGVQIASGMSYLSCLKFVHRDLAARNCMLDDNMNVKVADFGLSRDIYERDYYFCDNQKSRLPIRWMALESLERGAYSSKTDVWSYGVVLWELMTRGVCPYPDVDNWDVLTFLRSGRRLLQPTYCPDLLYEAMLSCWHPASSSRPSFEELVRVLSEIIGKMERLGDEFHDSSAFLTNNNSETEDRHHSYSNDVNNKTVDTEAAGYVHSVDTEAIGDVHSVDTEAAGYVHSVDTEAIGDVHSVDTVAAGYVHSFDTGAADDVHSVDTEAAKDVHSVDNEAADDVNFVDTKAADDMCFVDTEAAGDVHSVDFDVVSDARSANIEAAVYMPSTGTDMGGDVYSKYTSSFYTTV